MYDVHLEASHFPAQAESLVLPTTVGEVLRRQASAQPQAPTLVECDVAGRLGRRCRERLLPQKTPPTGSPSTPGP